MGDEGGEMVRGRGEGEREMERKWKITPPNPLNQ